MTENFKRGKILVATSGSGQSGSFEVGVDGWNQQNVVALTEELIGLCESSTSEAGVNDDGDQAHTQAIFAQMVTWLYPVTKQGYDPTMIGFPNYWGGPIT